MGLALVMHIGNDQRFNAATTDKVIWWFGGLVV